MKNKFGIGNKILIGISLLLSWNFYKDFFIALLILFIVFELLKSDLISKSYLNIKNKTNITFNKIVMGMGIIMCTFSFIGTVGNLINDYETIKEDSIKKIETKEWLTNKEEQKTLKQELAIYEKELTNYPTIEELTKNIPSNHSTNIKTITNNWFSNKKKNTDNIVSTNKKLTQKIAESKKLTQYKTVKKVNHNKSYTNLFDKISNIISCKTDLLMLLLFVTIGLLLELSIIVTKLLSLEYKEKVIIQKPSSNYSKDKKKRAPGKKPNNKPPKNNNVNIIKEDNQTNMIDEILYKKIIKDIKNMSYVISTKTIIDNHNINKNQWAKIRNRLKKEQIIESKGTKLFKKEDVING